MNAHRSISLVCAIATAGCSGQPGPADAALPAETAEHTPAVDPPRTMLIAVGIDDPLIATESLSRLDSGARGEGIRPTRGASGLQP
ncbi:MAG TPA: hypothetical protein VGE16_16235 [Albitalea sp.]